MSRFPRSASRDSFLVNDWWRSISRPVPYRINGNSTHVSVCQVMKLFVMILAALTVVLFITSVSGTLRRRNVCLKPASYNSTYPLSAVDQSADGGVVFKIALVSDLDTKSRERSDHNIWISYFREGFLSLAANNDATVSFNDAPKVLKSSISEGGRGMELSELIVFNGKLYTCDDRTGIVFELKNGRQLVPWVILSDGDGSVSKAFKCEWATVKEERLWIGGLGKEWTTEHGIISHYNAQWVKSVGVKGDVEHHNWIENYQKLRLLGGFQRPGYMIHESAMWSDVHQQWFFLPRRASKETYAEMEDEHRATNLMFRASEDFSQVTMSHIGPLHVTRGFSSFKFVPGTNDEVIIALKSEEVNGHAASYIMVFNLNGDVLLDETHVGDYKYEGVEFI